MSDDKCRPVEVDGEVIRVHGEREMTPAEVEAFADIVRAAKRKLRADCSHLHQTDVAAPGDRRVWGYRRVRACLDCGQVCEP